FPASVCNVAGKRTVYQFDPLTDERWPELLAVHPRASIFHSVEWLRALQKTYGYRPVCYTTCSPDQYLTNALVLCRVDSWLTGRRLVSNPFSDYCDPLLDDDPDFLESVLGAVQEEAAAKNLRYFE